MKYLPLVFIFWLISCTTSSQKGEGQEVVTNSIRDNADFTKIDFHTHYSYDREYFMPLLKKWNMQTLLIDVPKEDLVQNDTLWAALKAQYHKYPEQFYLCAGFESSNIDDPEFANKIIAKLEDDFTNGARMVKVWKIHGMVTKDASGKYIQIDDPRIQAIWDYLEKYTCDCPHR